MQIIPDESPEVGLAAMIFVIRREPGAVFLT
jgi:hypothetical protein